MTILVLQCCLVPPTVQGMLTVVGSGAVGSTVLTVEIIIRCSAVVLTNINTAVLRRRILYRRRRRGRYLMYCTEMYCTKLYCSILYCTTGCFRLIVKMYHLTTLVIKIRFELYYIIS